MSSAEQAHAFANPVIHTLELSGLDPSQLLLHDESMFAIFGLRQATIATVIMPRQTFKDLRAKGETPTGFRVVSEPIAPTGQERMFSLDDPATGSLPLRITTFAHPGHGTRFSYLSGRADRFHSRVGTLACIHPSYALSRKNPPKSQQEHRDVVLINAFYERRERRQQMQDS